MDIKGNKNVKINKTANLIRKIEIIKRIKWKFEDLKNTMSEVKNSLDTFNSIFKMTGDRISEERSIDIIQAENRREKRLKNYD